MDAFKKAYQAWFSDYEAARKRVRKRRGAPVPGLPAAPTHPGDIAAKVAAIGRRRVLAVLEIHPTTLNRWLTGRCVIPRASWLILVLLSEGRLPGMSTDWQDFRFDGDTLTIPGTTWRYSARELAGWPMLEAHRRALEDEVSRLRKKIAHLLTVGDFGAANDAVQVAGV